MWTLEFGLCKVVIHNLVTGVFLTNSLSFSVSHGFPVTTNQKGTVILSTMFLFQISHVHKTPACANANKENPGLDEELVNQPHGSLFVSK